MIDAVFGSRIVVYVEDEITSRYLNAVIGDNGKMIGFLAVGGAKTVLGMLEEAAQGNRKDVTFGVIDRDYACGDNQGWHQRSGVCYYLLPNHEIENYLLDFEAISRFTPKGRSTGKLASHWRDIAHTVAEKYLYSIVYNQLIKNVQRELSRDFPQQITLSSSPNSGYTIIANGEILSSTDDVVMRFEAEHWFAEIGNGIVKFRQHDNLVRLAKSIEARYEQLLVANDDEWTREFPGKEMFGAVANAMSLTSEEKLELARWIGESQERHNAIPADIQEFLKRIKEA